MGLKWNDLSGTLQWKLEQDILDYCVVDEVESSETKELWLGPNLTSSTILSTFLYACTDLDYMWNLKMSVREAIFSALCQCFNPNQPFSVRNLLKSLESTGRIGVKWSDVRTDVKITLLEGIKMHWETLNLRILLNG
jgi:hypothetical protein